MYTFPKNTNQLNALITDAISSAKTMRDKVQIASVAILWHAEKHGDYSKANDLIFGLGQGVKRDSLVAWFVKYGGLVVCQDDPNTNGFISWKGAEYIRDAFDAAKINMWYDVKKDKPFVPYSLEDELKKVLSKHSRELKKAQDYDEEKKALVNTNVSDDTIKLLLTLVDLEMPTVEDELSLYMKEAS